MTDPTADTETKFHTRLIAAWAWLQRAYAWCGGHQIVTAIVGGALVGFILGKWL